MNLLFLFQQPDPETAETTTKVGVGMIEKVGGTIGIVFCGILMLGAAVMYLVMSASAIMRRFGDTETEKQWERENVPGGGEGVTDVPGVKYGLMSFLIWAAAIVPILAGGIIPTTWGFDTWKEYGRTFVPRLLAFLVFLVLATILGVIGGFFLGQADAIKTTAEAAAKAANSQDIILPGSYTVYTLISGVFLGAIMFFPIYLATLAFKGMFKKSIDQDAIMVSIDSGTRSQLWSEWLKDKVWVERKQSKHFVAMLKPALIVYAVMVVGTMVVYGILCIFIPGARDAGFPFSSGGPYWLFLLIPPMVCAPPFLPLFASLLLGVPMRRKIREAGTVAS